MSATASVRTGFAAASVAALAFAVAPAVAGTSLTLPAAGSGAVAGGGLTITNTADSPGGGQQRPFGIEGIATGTKAGGVLGRTTRRDGVGVYGLAGGTGFGGYFLLSGRAATEGDSALDAINAGGSASVNGPYGTAGFFKIANLHNTDTALFVETFGNGNAFHAETHGAETASAAEGYDYSSIGGTGVFGYSLNGNAAEFVHGSGGNNSCVYNGASSGWSCSNSAAMMENLAPVDVDVLLRRLTAMPIAYFTTWGAARPAREIGPSAEAFHAAFGLGRGDKRIAAGDATGVALAAAQGLYHKLAADEAEIAGQRQQIAALERELATQRVATAKLAEAVAGLAPRPEMQPAHFTAAPTPPLLQLP
jgi:hypothetical protein